MDINKKKKTIIYRKINDSITNWPIKYSYIFYRGKKWNNKPNIKNNREKNLVIKAS